MTKRRSYLKILFVLMIIVSACAKSPSPGGGGDLPVANAPEQKVARDQAEADFLDQTFDFTMNAYLKDFDVSTIAGSAGVNLYPANMISNWGGEFTIDPDGNLTGKGRVVTEANIFNVDEDWCGYAFLEEAEHEFLIGGTLKKVGEKYYFPIKIWSRKYGRDSDPASAPDSGRPDRNGY